MEELKRIRFAKEAENPFYLNDPQLLEIVKKCLPPKESYYYFPKGEEIITIHPKKPIKSIRRVFYNAKYSEYENKMLNELKQIINSHPELKLPDYFIDYLILMFVYARGGDLNESYNLIVEYLKFIEKTFPMTVTPNSKIIEILNKGFIYVYGRDNRFRPIIVCQAKVFQNYEKSYKFEELLQATSLLCQFVINNMIIPGQFETWDMLVNLKGVSVISLPDSLKKLIPALSNYFLCRLNKTYVMGLNFFTRILYKIAVNFIDPITASKIIVLDEKGDPKLFKNIRPDNIEQQFGGTAPDLSPDIPNSFFPPRMPSPHFIKDEENKNDILISEDEYIKKYKNGEIPIETVSPYIYNKLKEEEIKESQTQINEINNNISDKKTDINESINKNDVPMIKENIVKKDINLERKRFLDAKKNHVEKFKKFVSCDWEVDEEITKMYYNQEYNVKNNIINDINIFSRKKQKYTNKIFLFNK